MFVCCVTRTNNIFYLTKSQTHLSYYLNNDISGQITGLYYTEMDRTGIYFHLENQLTTNLML